MSECGTKDMLWIWWKWRFPDTSCRVIFVASVNVCELVAFENRDLAEDARGWSRLDWAVEFTRQGVDSEWGESDLNESYKVGKPALPAYWYRGCDNAPLCRAAIHIPNDFGCLLLPTKRR